MTLVILARQIDISIGSQFSVCGVVAGLLARDGLPVALAAAACDRGRRALGAVNGVLVAGLRLPSIVVTLATMVILREGLRWGGEGEFVRDLPDGFQWFGLGGDAGPWAVVGVAVAVFAGVRLGAAEPGRRAGRVRHRVRRGGRPARRHPARPR